MIHLESDNTGEPTYIYIRYEDQIITIDYAQHSVMSVVLISNLLFITHMFEGKYSPFILIIKARLSVF